MSDIRNMDKFIASKWSFRYFDESFLPTHVSFGDLDGIVERNGRFLVLETKGIGVPVPNGQAVMFSRMVETGLFTVVVLWGNAPDVVTHWRIWPGDKHPADRLRVRTFIADWWRQAQSVAADRIFA